MNGFAFFPKEEVWNDYSKWDKVEKDVPPGSSLSGPPVIMVHIIDMFLIINLTCRANFADNKKLISEK